MASSYTTNYHLDKYVGTDKPNLRDQYNAAMDKIDSALLAANTNATEAKAATQSFQGDLTALSNAISSETSARQSADTALAGDIAANTTAISNEASARQSADTDLASSISQNSTDIEANAAAIVNEASARAAEDTRIVGLINAMNLSSKKIVCIGDSLTRYTPLALDSCWPAYLASYLGCDCYNFAVGSSGFTVGTTFGTQIQNAGASSSFDNEDITDVIIIGGYNDYASNYSAMYQAATAVIASAKSTFPNAKIHVGAMLHGAGALDTATGGASTSQKRSPLISPISEAAILGGCDWIDGCWYWCVGKSAYDYGDGIHTTAQGQAYIARFIARHMQNQSTDRVEFATLSPDANLPSALSDFKGKISAQNGFVYLQASVTKAANQTLPSGIFKVATLPEWARIDTDSSYNPAVIVTNNSDLDTTKDYTWLGRFFVGGNSLWAQQMNFMSHYAESIFATLTYPFGI